MKVLEIKNIQKYYGTKSNVTKALNDLSFDVEQDEFVAIMGASGSGKTTLLNCVSTIDRVTSGHILINNHDITALNTKQLSKFRREQLGFIFQDFNLIDTLTAYENISLALSIQHKEKDMKEKIHALAKELDIEQVLDKYPYEMSGGQKQRVAAERALITSPSMILADEPTGALDSRSSKMMLEKMALMNQSHKATILMVTHDALAASYGSRVIFIKDGQIFHEIYKGNDDRKTFFNKIIEVESVLGGDLNDL